MAVEDYNPNNIIHGFRNQWAFLSNFHRLKTPLVEVFQGVRIEYRTSEHAYQAAKTDSLEHRLEVAAATTPMEAKRLGRKWKAKSNWDKIKNDVMLFWVREKFKDPMLAQLLLNTGDADIVEVNHHGDQYWGTDIFLEGENWLGKILMQVRSELAESSL